MYQSLLHIALNDNGRPQWGLVDALKLIARNYYEIDWMKTVASKGIPGLNMRLRSQLIDTNPILYLHSYKLQMSLI